MYVYLLAALLALSVGFGSGWKVRAWKASSDDADRVSQVAHDAAVKAERVDTAATAHEAFKAAVQVREHIVYREVERVIEKPVYSNVCLDDDGLRIIAADIAARTAPSEPAPALPSASAPGKH